jgi:hypothetical protein
MFANKGITILLSTLIFTLSSSIVYAAEDSNSAVAGWPLLVFIAIVVIFRKKIFSNDAFQEPPIKEVEKKAAAVVIETKAKSAQKPEKKEKPTSKAKPKSSSDSIDLTEDGKQCQASTAKGTRCKRTNTLDTASIKIEEVTYQVTVCSQHNNKNLKPYSKLIKK